MYILFATFGSSTALQISNIIIYLSASHVILDLEISTQRNAMRQIKLLYIYCVFSKYLSMINSLTFSGYPI